MVLAVIGLGYWGWDATHHDGHDEPHATPVSYMKVEREMSGKWSMDDGTETVVVESARCSPGEDGNAHGVDVHFRCDLVLKDGTSTSRVIHIVDENFGLGPMMLMRDP